MFHNILVWYVITSYVVGFFLFVWELIRTLVMRSKAIRAQRHTMMDLSRYIKVGNVITMGIVLLLLAPLTTWHGLLHYSAILWAKISNKPIKYWL
jgi:hypothetical protein